MKFQISNFKFQIKLIAFSILIYHLSFIIYLPSKVYAQSYSLSISPSLLEVIIKPGKTVTQQFKIQNLGDETIVTPEIIPLKLDHKTGDISISYNEKLAQNIDSWFSLDNPDNDMEKPFFLKNNEQKELLLKISIPEDEQPGDHYLLLSLKSKSPPIGLGSESTVESVIGANILISVTTLGTLNKTGEISSLNFPIIMDSFDSLEGQIKIKNSGSAFFKPIGKVTLKGPFLSAEYPLLPQNILSGTTRVVKTIQDLDQKTQTSADKTLSLKGFFLGPYTFKAEFKPDGTSLNLEKSVRIIAFPWKASLVIGLFVLAIYLYKKKNK